MKKAVSYSLLDLESCAPAALAGRTRLFFSHPGVDCLIWPGCGDVNAHHGVTQHIYNVGVMDIVFDLVEDLAFCDIRNTPNAIRIIDCIEDMDRTSLFCHGVILQPNLVFKFVAKCHFEKDGSACQIGAFSESGCEEM